MHRSDGTSRRLASFGAGSLVGELALLGNEPRLVDVRADTDLECHALTVDAIVELGALRPEARVRLFANMLRIVASLADQLRNLGFTYDGERDVLTDSFGLVYTRVASN